MCVCLPADSIHISWSKKKQLLQKSVLKLTPTLPPYPSLVLILGQHWVYEYGRGGWGRLSLLRRITSSQIAIHPHKDRLMFPPNPSNYSPVLKYSLFMAPPPLSRRFSTPICAGGVFL